MHDLACRPIERGQLVAVDGASQIVAVHMVQGLIKVLPLESRSGQLRARETQNCRIDELQILDIQFLSDTSEPTLAVLHQTVADTFRLRTFKVSPRGKDLGEGPWTFDDLDYGSHMLISVPSPKGGVLVIADESILYYSPGRKAQCALATKPTRISCYCRVDDDGHRYLLADSEGALYVLILFGGSAELVESLKLEYLGRTVIASCMTYLDNGFVFIGSQMGDSQIIRLHAARLPTGGFVEVIDTLQGAAPIVDFITVDLEKIGQSSIAACSGAFKEGGIRLMRKGANILPDASADLDLTVRSVFTLAKDAGDILFFSGLFETHIFQYQTKQEQRSLDQVHSWGSFDLGMPSLLIASMSGYDLQVTASGLYCHALERQAVWRPASGLTILFATTARAHDGQGAECHRLALVTVDQTIHLFDLSKDPGRPFLSKQLSGAKKISALAMSWLGGTSLLLFIAHWNDPGVRVHDVERDCSLECGLRTTSQIKSLRVVTLDSTHYLLAGLGNGSVVHAEVSYNDSGALSLGVIHRAMIGTAPVRLHCCLMGPGLELLLATSDRCFVVKAIRGRLAFSMTNIRGVHDVVGLAGTGQILLLRDRDAVIGTLDESSKSRLHHQVKSMGDTTTRIVRLASSGAYAVLVTDQKHIVEAATCRSRVVLLDQDTLGGTVQ